MKKRDELMQKEKVDIAASFHAGQIAAGAAAHMNSINTIAAFNAGMPPMHLAHPGVMSAAAAASSALSHL